MVEGREDLDADAVHMWINDELTRKYPNDHQAVTVLSHEELSGHPNGYRLVDSATIAENLWRLFPQAKILVIVRNQLDYLMSMYTYRVAIKGYETRSFTRYIQEEGEKGLLDHLEYHRLVERYQELFGASQILVLPMEMLKKNPKELYDKLFTFLRVPHREIRQSEPMNVSTKSSLVISIWRPINWMFSVLLRMMIFLARKESEAYPFRKFRYSYYHLKRKATKMLNGLFRSSKSLDIRVIRGYPELLERFENSNARLEKIANMDLVALGYPVHKE